MPARASLGLPLAALAALGLGAAPAAADGPVAVAPAAPPGAADPGAPAIVGDAVAWPESPLRVRLATSGGGAARTIFAPGVPADQGDLDRAQLVGGDGALAFDFQASDGGNTGGDDHDPETTSGVVAGPAAGPLAPLAAEGDDPPVAVDGTTVASVSGTPAAVLLTDVAGAPPRTLALPAPAAPDVLVDAVALSAQLVAVARSGSSGDGSVVVLDRATGQPAWATSVPSGSLIGLQADGTLDVATQVGSRYRLATATQAAPALRTVATTPGVAGTPAVRAGRIAFAGTAPAAGRERRAQVALQAFEGTPAQRLGFVGPRIVGVDVSGERVAWRTPDCVYAQDLPGTAADVPPAGPCPRAVAELAGPAPKVVAGRTARITVSCVAAPGACRTALRLVAGGRTLARASVAVPAGSARTARLRFPRTLPRRGAVEVRATTTDDAGRTATRALTYR